MKTASLYLIFLLPYLAYAHVEHVQTKDNMSNISLIEDKLLEARITGNEDLYRNLLVELEQKVTTDRRYFVYLAEVQQHFHLFDEALTSLNKAPDSVSKFLLRANIYLLRGEPSQASHDCRNLFIYGKAYYGMVCNTLVKSYQGELENSIEVMLHLIESADGSDAGIVLWAMANLADMAERSGDDALAEQYYKVVLDKNPQDTATRLSYADLLLRNQRFDDVLVLTKEHLMNDANLLRYVRALNIQGDKRMSGHFCELKGRVIHYKEDQQHLHYDTMAEYYFYFTEDVEAAMKWARRHWQEQKSPRDTRLLATIAVTVGDIEVIEEIRTWQQINGIEDSKLDAILAGV